MSAVQQTTFAIDGRDYAVDWARKVHAPDAAPRLVVVSYLPNATARRILQTCLASIQRMTATPHELWVVDNHSPAAQLSGLLELPGVNVALSRTLPLPPERRAPWQRLLQQARGQDQTAWGSYANAIGLEIARRVIDPSSRYLMTLHMDTVACAPHWLDYLLGKLDDRVAAAGVRMERGRVPAGVLHVLGLLMDYAVVQRLGLDFFPDLPAYDVGDRITVGLRAAGYAVFACANTFTDPAVAAALPHDSPYAALTVDRSLDDTGQVIFMHLGRGLPKSANRQGRGVSAAAWVEFAQTYLMAEPSAP
jgi:hypothetical protein